MGDSLLDAAGVVREVFRALNAREWEAVADVGLLAPSHGGE